MAATRQPLAATLEDIARQLETRIKLTPAHPWGELQISFSRQHVKVDQAVREMLGDRNYVLHCHPGGPIELRILDPAPAGGMASTMVTSPVGAPLSSSRGGASDARPARSPRGTASSPAQARAPQPVAGHQARTASSPSATEDPAGEYSSSDPANAGENRNEAETFGGDPADAGTP